MKRTLAMIFLAVLTVGLLGSCTKSYDERLDKIDSDVLGLKEAVGQYESLSGDITSVIEALRAELGTRPASEQQSVWNCITALQNQKGTFDAAIAALNALIGDKPVSEQIDGATAELISKYQLDGLAADIQAIKDKLTEKTGISALSEQVAQLQKKADTIVRLLSEIDDLGTMVQSVRINPASADGSVMAEDGILTFTFTVTPAEALSGVKNLAGCLKLYSNEVKTKAGVFPEIPVTFAEIIDAEKGEVSVEADVAEYLPEENTRALSVALNVRTGVSNYTTEFVPVTVAAEYVEIGGVKWAKKNLGATTVAGSGETCYGDYYAWGETAPYYEGTGGWPATPTWKSGKESGYFWSSYCGSSKFVEWSTPPYDATTKILKPEFDAAAQTLGDGWRMPTSQEFQNLADACGGSSSYDMTTYASTACGKATTFTKGIYWCGNYDGVSGALFCDGNNKLFFPAAGYGNGTSLSNAGSSGYYWSSSPGTFSPESAYCLNFKSGYVNLKSSTGRYCGVSVRPVKDAK